MSRAEARRTFTVEDHIRWTEGVECCKDEGVLESLSEAPMNSQEDLQVHRNDIDRIDSEILRLLNERAKSVMEIGRIKIESGVTWAIGARRGACQNDHRHGGWLIAPAETVPNIRPE